MHAIFLRSAILVINSKVDNLMHENVHQNYVKISREKNIKNPIN